MGNVKKFELLHGIVLAKVVRAKKVSLSLVETNVPEDWAAYTINDEVILHLKYRLCSMKRQEKIVWVFRFSPEELARIKEISNQKPVYPILICGMPSISDADKMQVCLLTPEDSAKCIDENAQGAQAITVEVTPHQCLRVYGSSNKKDKLVISRNRLDTWEIPGS